MTEALNSILAGVSLIYFVKQTMAVIYLCIIGFIVVYKTATNVKNSRSMSTDYIFLLAFPVGMSVFALSGVFLLCVGIKYTAVSVTTLTFIITALFALLIKTKNTFGEFVSADKKRFILYALVTVAAVLVSVSGIVSIVYSNDSMYYYSVYPREIVISGYLKSKFDTFLTDAGQATAVINTIPYLFGFNETFGIHTFFNINFVAFFAHAIFDQASIFNDKRKQAVLTVIVTLVLVTSMPFVFISKWIIANMYFMEIMFYVVYLNHEADDNASTLYVRVILTAVLSTIRVEGVLFAGLTILVYLMQENTKKRDVVLLTTPVIILQILYYLRIFVFIEIIAPYTFMTKGKAVIAVAYIAAVLVYGLVYANDSILPALRDRLKLLSPVPGVFIILVLVNAALFVYDRAVIVSNVKVFAGNILGQSGWGFFAAVVAAFIMLVPKVKIKDLYYELFCLGFVLVAFAACYARGDGLRVNLYDSSNRVMLQIVPFVVFAIAYRYIKASLRSSVDDAA